jgi:hypothetical protein
MDSFEIIGQLGAAAAVTAVCYWLIQRYSALVDRAIARVEEANLARIADAKEQSAQIERILNVQVQFMQHLAISATALKTSAESLESIAANVPRSRHGGKGGSL